MPFVAHRAEGTLSFFSILCRFCFLDSSISLTPSPILDFGISWCDLGFFVFQFRIFLGFLFCFVLFFCFFVVVVVVVGVLGIWLCFGNDISFYVIVRIEKKKKFNVVFQGNPSTHFWIWFKDGILELWFTFEANIVDVWWSFMVWKCSLKCKEQWSNTCLDYWSGCCFMSFADLFLDWDISDNFEPCCYAYFLLSN